jgi:hypothetical protein
LYLDPSYVFENHASSLEFGDCQLLLPMLVPPV